MGADWKSELREKARRQGFGDVRVAAATVPPEAAIHYRRWLAQAFHGEMRYMDATTELRLAPERLLPDARSVLVFRADYYPHSMRPSAQPGMARIAKYALGLDYHYVLRARLHQIAMDEAAAAASDARKSQVRTVDRSERIRTYNFPENRISDHRTGYKAYNLDIFLGGELDPAVESLMAADEAARLAALGES